MTGGYTGKLLFVNLSDKRTKAEGLDYDMARRFLGGYGLSSRILYDRQKAGIDPLSEESIFSVSTGPLTGTGLPVVSRFNISGKSPLTGGWGDANARGYFGPTLKFAGYDAIFFDGISEKPVYLLVENEKIEIIDAQFLWGKDTYETEDLLKEKYGSKAQVACIGPSGEKLSKIAAVITTKGKAAARSGLGALMGSKKLKAVVVIGSEKLKISKPDEFEILRKKYMKQIKDGVGYSGFYASTGTPGYVETGAMNADSPVKNWFGLSKELGNIDEYKYSNMEKYIVRRGTCHKCPMGDWKEVIIKDGPYASVEESHIPEYETTSAFGSYCCNTNFESIIKCNDICNRYGIDTISTGAIISFAMSCYENGILTKKDTDGIELTWGNHDAVVKTTEKIAKREGFGEILADGVKIASEKIGRGSEKYAIHVGGQELPAHDSRYEPSMASIYRNEATPGRHGQASQYSVPPKLAELLPDVDFSFSFGNKRNIFTGRAKAQKALSALNHCVNAIGMCLWGYLGTEATFMHECFSAVTGWDVDLKEMLATGERIGNMRMAFSIREGLVPVKLAYPEIARGNPPLTAGPTKDITLDLELITKEFCQEMGWDYDTGKPSKDKLKELGLEDLIKDLWG